MPHLEADGQEGAWPADDTRDLNLLVVQRPQDAELVSELKHEAGDARCHAHQLAIAKAIALQRTWEWKGSGVSGCWYSIISRTWT